MALSYWTRALYTTLLLPRLRASDRRTRVISIYAAGMESSSIPLDDLDLKKPGAFGVLSSAKTCATLNTVFFEAVAGDESNKGIAFIHNHPGEVNTGIVEKGWGGIWGVVMPYVFMVLQPVVHLLGTATSVERSGENCLYLITGAEYDGKDGAGADKKPDPSGFYMIDGKMRRLWPSESKTLAELESKNGKSIIMDATQEVMGPFMGKD
jgi:hypothetical protein